MRQIFDMQHELNKTVLNNLGIDYDLILSAPERHGHWIENYRKALSAEYAEFLRDWSSKDGPTDNAKIEVIDMLHFLVSLSQIVGISPEEAMREEDGIIFDDEARDISEVFFLALDDLQNSVRWKWWSKGGSYKPESARLAVSKLWQGWWEIATEVTEMLFDEIKAIYIKKNAVNFKRQEMGYDADKKTEDDNLAIIAGMKTEAGNLSITGGDDESKEAD